MRIYKYILSFLAVGFVLAFQGKISKHELYRAYFSAIQDLADRNSHALSLAPFLESDYYFEAETVPQTQSGGLLALASQPTGYLFPPAGDWDMPLSEEVILPTSGALNFSFPTRAP